MNKTAIAFLTKDRVELSRQSIEPLLATKDIDVFWIDGSVTDEGRFCPFEVYAHTPMNHRKVYGNVTGGAGAAIVFALTKMLEGPYDHVGLVENDVLLDPDWFGDTMALFSTATAVGLGCGAVSARNYQDRVLFQREGYSVNHNTGAGCIIFSRAAAELALNHFRSGYTTDNRKIFGRLSGVDITPFWAFKSGDHPLVADWAWDAMLASHGYASLALTPSRCQMIGQDPPLAEQGLTLVTEPVQSRIDEAGFNIYRARLQTVALGLFNINIPTDFHYDIENNCWNYAPHQFHKIGGAWKGAWAFKEVRAHGEFAFVAQEVGASVRIPVGGLCSVIAGGGESGGQLRVEDEYSGYHAAPFIAPEVNGAALQIPIPSKAPSRFITLTAMTPGVCIYRLVCKEQQATLPTMKFDYSCLPPAVVKHG